MPLWLSTNQFWRQHLEVRNLLLALDVEFVLDCSGEQITSNRSSAFYRRGLILFKLNESVIPDMESCVSFADRFGAFLLVF